MSDRLARTDGSDAPPRVLIAGGGVAALEAVLALRASAGMRVEISLLAPHPHLRYPPLEVVEPFGLATPSIALDTALSSVGASFRLDAVEDVDTLAHRVRTRGGAVLAYEALVLAIGARRERSIPGALAYGDRESRAAFTRLLEAAEAGEAAGLQRLLFAVPDGVRWPLPLYELAIMTARWLRARPGAAAASAHVALATPESAPLELFGGRASGRLLEYLESLGIAFLPRSRVERADRGEAHLAGSTRPVRADRVVTIPRLRGPAPSGIPHDAEGFVPVDAHGAVRGVSDVYAAGDATDFPVKQGGLATQQADAIAEAIAARSGAPVAPAPFRPVLRGVLLTSERPHYLESTAAGGAVAGPAPLWWPPLKVAGRHLAPFLAARLGTSAQPASDERWLQEGIPCEIALPPAS